MYVDIVNLIRELLDNNGLEDMSIDSYLETVKLYGIRQYKKTDGDTLRDNIYISSGNVDLFLWSYDSLDHEIEEYLNEARILSLYIDEYSTIWFSSLKESVDLLRVNLQTIIKEAGFVEDSSSKKGKQIFYNYKFLPQLKIMIDDKDIDLGFLSFTLSFPLSIGDNRILKLESSLKAITESFNNSGSEFKWKLCYIPLTSEKVENLADGGYYKIYTTYRQYSISDSTIVREPLQQCMSESEALFNELISLIIE